MITKNLLTKDKTSFPHDCTLRAFEMAPNSGIVVFKRFTISDKIIAAVNECGKLPLLGRLF